MKRAIAKILNYGFVRIVGKERMKKIIPTLAGLSDIDLMTLAYNSMGILKFGNEFESGEHFFVSKVLKDYLKAPAPVLFDVGANIGKYAQMLSREFPEAKIFSFEPNRNTFEILKQNIKQKAECVNAGLGSEPKTGKIYTYAESVTSSHASVYSDVFKVFHGADKIVDIDFEMITIDAFCAQKGIKEIDLLKIDTEGNELEVLKGSRRMLSEDRIKILQFEFGECDVFSRVFLRDFYEMLPNYRIYRLDSKSLIPLFEYNSANEIFRFQNFVAINRKLADR
ncbi:MAG: FkbM family methyltransferase [Deltaproteobacteria bacterium]|nr:FkbM family methyltransferase [Deltaproteobacteria bacterium]